MGPARPLRHVRGPRGQNLGWNICSLPRCPTISPSHLPCLGPRLNMDGAVRSSAPAATAISKLVKRRERLPQPFGTHRNVCAYSHNPPLQAGVNYLEASALLLWPRTSVCSNDQSQMAPNYHQPKNLFSNYNFLDTPFPKKCQYTLQRIKAFKGTG